MKFLDGRWHGENFRLFEETFEMSSLSCPVVFRESNRLNAIGWKFLKGCERFVGVLTEDSTTTFRVRKLAIQVVSDDD